MATMPADDAPVEVAPGLDFNSLTLTNEEGFLLSRAMGRRQSVKELVDGSGLGAQARGIIEALLKKGALTVVSARASGEGDPIPEDEEERYSDIVFPLRDLNESNDLSVEQKKRILYIEMHLDEWNHYALLDLKRTARPADVKKGYFKASKEFHPDAHFRKELGTYKRRLDRIFRAMKAAYDVLNNPQKREEYDEGLDPMDLTPEEKRELVARAREKRVEAEKRAAEERAEREKEERARRTAERLKERRIKKNPMVDRLKRANELISMAESAKENGNLSAAGRHARMALDFSKGDESIAARARPIIEEGGQDRGRALAKLAEELILAGETHVALDRLEEAAEVAPRDAVTLVSVAELYRKLKKPRTALKYAQKATELSPKEARPWMMLLDLCEAEGNWHTAVRAAERLVALKPNDKAFKDRWKRAKRESR